MPVNVTLEDLGAFEQRITAMVGEIQTKQAACEQRETVLVARVEQLASEITQLYQSNETLVTKLLDLGSGRVARAEARGDERFKLLLGQFGGPVTKLLGALAALIGTITAAWVAGHWNAAP